MTEKDSVSSDMCKVSNDNINADESIKNSNEEKGSREKEPTIKSQRQKIQ